MNAQDLAALQDELLRVVARGGYYGTFVLDDGSKIEGATESDVIKHLTARFSPVSGRKFRFPGIGNGWRFSSEVEAAGFRIVRAKNARGQNCRVVTL